MTGLAQAQVCKSGAFIVKSLPRSWGAHIPQPDPMGWVKNQIGPAWAGVGHQCVQG